MMMSYTSFPSSPCSEDECVVLHALSLFTLLTLKHRRPTPAFPKANISRSEAGVFKHTSLVVVKRTSGWGVGGQFSFKLLQTPHSNSPSNCPVIDSSAITFPPPSRQLYTTAHVKVQALPVSQASRLKEPSRFKYKHSSQLRLSLLWAIIIETKTVH